MAKIKREIQMVKVIQEFNLDDGSGEDYPIFEVGEIYPFIMNGYNGNQMIFYGSEWYDVVFTDEELPEFLEFLPLP